MSDDRTYAIMVKPVGSACNLHCEYCYYLSKHSGGVVMQNDVLERTISEVLRIHGKDAVVEFAWHGGEPTLAGIPFYEKALKLEEKYGKGRQILNTIQTNGQCIDDAWARFFKQNNFLVGVSIDGPEKIDDFYRKTEQGEGAFRKTIRALEILHGYDVDVNILATVNAVNQDCGEECYRFLRQYASYLQFLPVVECLDQDVAMPPGRYSDASNAPVASFSVSREGFGRFLTEVFSIWEREDQGHVQVQQFSGVIAAMQGKPCGLCTHEAICGHASVIERNGDVFRCDRYTFPSYRSGNVMETPLDVLMEGNREFGMHKALSLPDECLDCPFLKLCFGGCPKDRFIRGVDLKANRSYLCPSYQIFYSTMLRWWNEPERNKEVRERKKTGNK